MNESKASGFLDEAKGKLKQAVGETFNDQSMANEGAADEVKGHAEQTWGNVKDTAHDLSHEQTTSHPLDANNPSTDAASDTGHDIRSGITNAAHNLKDSIDRGLDHLKKH